MRAFREICTEEGFDELNVLERVSEVEDLGRAREIVFKNMRGGGIEARDNQVRTDIL